ATIYDVIPLILGVVVFILALFVLPFGFFSPMLLRRKERGVREYGALSRTVGEEFERKWLSADRPDGALQSQDFSATTDLYQTASVVHEMTFWPTDRRVLRRLLLA